MTVDTSLPANTSAVEAGSGLTVEVLAEVLFCSNLQPSQSPTVAEVLRALIRGLSRDGDPVRDCVAQLASAYGKNPDSACERMRWARSTVLAFFGRPGVAA